MRQRIECEAAGARRRIVTEHPRDDTMHHLMQDNRDDDRHGPHQHFRWKSLRSVQTTLPLFLMIEVCASKSPARRHPTRVSLADEMCDGHCADGRATDACKFASLKYRYVRASPAPRANRLRPPTDASQSNVAGCAG